MLGFLMNWSRECQLIERQKEKDKSKMVNA